MKYLYRLMLVVLLIPGLSACISHRLNLKEGINSFRVEDYRRAFIRLKLEAERGQPDAQYAVGYMYYYGKGVVEDRKKHGFGSTLLQTLINLMPKLLFKFWMGI